MPSNYLYIVMKKEQLYNSLIVAVIIVAVLGITGWTIYSYNSEVEDSKTLATKQPATPIIGVFDVKKKIDNKDDFLLVDVRSKEDFKAGHVQGATNMPINAFRQGSYTTLPVNKDLVLMCYGEGCPFSTEASEILYSNGYQQLFDMSAGISGWMSAGLPIIEAQSKDSQVNQFKVGIITVADLQTLMDGTEQDRKSVV